MEQPTVRIVYGLTLETGKWLRAEIEHGVQSAGIVTMPICRYRKEGVYQYMTEQQESVLILEEGLQASSPYVAEDIIKLTDTGKSKILFLLDRKHYGTDYTKTLYLCGILNAVYTDEVSGTELVRLLLSGRTNEEARKYYGIELHRDAQKNLAEINSAYLDMYLKYIEDSTLQSEMDSRYSFAASQLSSAENKVLIESLSPEVSRFLEGNETYRQYRSGRERRGFFTRLAEAGARKKQQEPLVEAGSVSNGLEAEPPTGFEPEPDMSWKASGCLGESEREEDMLAVLDRFRRFRGNEGGGEEQVVKRDTLIEFGHYLQTLDA